MSGGYTNAPRPSAAPVAAAVSLAVAAVAAVGGSFGAFYVHRFSAGSDLVVATTRNGWMSTTDPPSPYGLDVSAATPLLGIPLVVGAVVAVVAALLLVTGRHAPGGPGTGRLLGVAAAGVLLGAVACIWIELANSLIAIGAMVGDPRSGAERAFAPGLGAWLLLVAAVAALVAIASLLVRSGAPVPPGPYQGHPAQGPYQGYPPPGPYPGFAPHGPYQDFPPPHGTPQGPAQQGMPQGPPA